MAAITTTAPLWVLKANASQWFGAQSMLFELNNKAEIAAFMRRTPAGPAKVQPRSLPPTHYNVRTQTVTLLNIYSVSCLKRALLSNFPASCSTTLGALTLHIKFMRILLEGKHQKRVQLLSRYVYTVCAGVLHPLATFEPVLCDTQKLPKANK